MTGFEQALLIVLSIATLLLLVLAIMATVLIVMVLRGAKRISQKTEAAIDNINDVTTRISKHLAPGVISSVIAQGLKRWRNHEKGKEVDDE